MFESIEQLEHEIEVFRKNILASTALIDSLDALVSASKQQNNDFKNASSELLLKIDDHASSMKQTSEETLHQVKIELDRCTAEIHQATDKAIVQINNDSKQSLAEAIAQIHAAQQAYIEKLDAVSITLENLRLSNNAVSQTFTQKCDNIITTIQDIIDSLSAANKAHLDSAAGQISETQAEYIKSLQSTEDSMQELSAGLKQKYNEFLVKLEETNMNQVYQACLDMKKSIETKLMIVIALTGITAIAAIVSIVAK